MTPHTRPAAGAASPALSPRTSLALAVATLLATAFPPLHAETGEAVPTTGAAAAASAAELDSVVVHGERDARSTTTRLPLTARETPQSISQVTRESMDAATMLSINDVLMNVTGVNVTLYDSQRPLYFARGFQITDFQVDGIPTYSGSTNQEYDTALYERVEVIRGANGLLSGVGTPSATINLIRKRPSTEFDASVRATVGSFDLKRGEADVSLPLAADGRVRARAVAAYQDGGRQWDRYQENKFAGLGVIEADLTDSTVLAVGYQTQDNNPVGAIWGTIPLFYADGGYAHLPTSISFSPSWTTWQRESETTFVTLDQAFGADWRLNAQLTRTDGEVFSRRVYATGFPDRTTGAGMTLLAAVGETFDRRDGVDLYLTGKVRAFGREHDLVVGGSASELESTAMTFSSVAGWRYAVPNIYTWNGDAPALSFTRTGARRISTTEQNGFYASGRFRLGDPLSVVAGARVSDWKTRTDAYSATGAYTGTTGAYAVRDEVTPYFGAVYDLTRHVSLYASYTDIFRPQNYRDADNNLLEPVLGSNLEAGIKAELLGGRLTAGGAIFRTEQDNYAVRDPSQPVGSLPDGSSAYMAVDGTRSEGIEFDVAGRIRPGWAVNAGYTHVRTTRHPTDLIYTNLPEHYLQASTHYTLPGAWDALTLGAGVNWQSETVAYNVPHPSGTPVTYRQGSYVLGNLHATYRFNENLQATLSVLNAFDKVYWANIDYANYGEPRNVRLTFRWRY